LTWLEIYRAEATLMIALHHEAWPDDVPLDDAMWRGYRPVLARAMSHGDLIRVEFAYRAVDDLRRYVASGRHPGHEEEYEETVDLLRGGLAALGPLATGKKSAPTLTP
jgi:hypothetical protein